jgi:type II secretory pathway pseudopilin PulG
MCRGAERGRRRHAATLVELLVVVAILAAIVALVLMGIQGAREAARRIVCASNVRQLGLATAGYEQARREYPPGVRQWYFNAAVSHRGVPLFAWLLPHMDGAALLVRWDRNDPLNNVTRGRESPAAVVLPELVCPSDTLPRNPVTVQPRGWTYALTSYGGNGGTRPHFAPRATVDGMFHTVGEASEPLRNQLPVRNRDVTDGLSQTLLFGERSHVDPAYATFTDLAWGDPLDLQGWWGASASRKLAGHVMLGSWGGINERLGFTIDGRFGRDPPADTFAAFQEHAERRLTAYGSGHIRGVNACFADGRVVFLGDDTDAAVFRDAATRAGGVAAR